MEKIGIKETKEALCGSMEVLVCIVGQFSDGVQVADFAALWAKLQTDAAFKQKLMEAYEGANKIPGEIGDIDINESMELIGTLLPYIPLIIAAFKKKA